MSSRHFLVGFVKSVLTYRHAFIPSPAKTMEIGRDARLPSSFDYAFGVSAPKDVDTAFNIRRWSIARERLQAWTDREPCRPEPRLLAGLLKLWTAPGAQVRPGRLDSLIDRSTSRAGIRDLEHVVRDFPKWPQARMWLALAQLRRTDLAAARRELNALSATQPRWSTVFLLRSELARVDILYGRALKELDRAEMLDPRNSWVHAFRARVLFTTGAGAAGLKAMNRAIRLSPKEGWLYAWRADSRRKLGDLPGAAADLAAARRLEPGYDRIYLWSGKVLRAMGRTREAEAVLSEGIKLVPYFEKAYAERARARLELGLVDGALRDIEKAASTNHRHNSFWSWTAPISPLDDERRAVLKKLHAHATRFPRSARAWAWLGEALTQGGFFAEGLIALDRALRLEPGRPWLRTWRGEALLRLGRLTEAEHELNRALRADPLDGRAHAFRGRVFFLRGKPAEAVADLERAASDSMVEYSWIYSWRAEAKHAIGDHSGAGRDAQTAATLEPDCIELFSLRSLAKK